MAFIDEDRLQHGRIYAALHGKMPPPGEYERYCKYHKEHPKVHEMNRAIKEKWRKQ